jgi:hypothetical protein
MAVAFRAAGAALTDHVSGSPALDYPAGVVAGDLLVVQAVLTSSGTATPAGWTAITSDLANNAWGFSQLWYKIAGASEPSTLSIPKTANNPIAAVMSAYSGVDTTTPINASATTASSTSGVSPSVTTTVANTLLLRIYWSFSPASTIPPGTTTERYDVFDAWQTANSELGTEPAAAIGATGTTTATFGVGSMNGGSRATVAVAPGAAASGAGVAGGWRRHSKVR